jgi:hypothetical protein
MILCRLGRAKTGLSILPILLWISGSTFCQAHTCGLATEISVDNLIHRVLTPRPDTTRVDRAFEQLAAIDGRCSSSRPHIDVKDCAAVAEQSKKLGKLHKGGVEIFERVTGCKLAVSKSQDSTLSNPTRTKALVSRTLLEQRESDGEAAYWIADDLLALFLVYPMDVLAELESAPSFQKRFISDLGGRALEDLDDRPESKHARVHQKQKAIADLLPALRKKVPSGSPQRRILDQIAKACRCQPEAAR